MGLGSVIVVRPRSERCYEIEVAILGPTEVRGITAGFARASALELVVYLALHPDGAANDTWATDGKCSRNPGARRVLVGDRSAFASLAAIEQVMWESVQSSASWRRFRHA